MLRNGVWVKPKHRNFEKNPKFDVSRHYRYVNLNDFYFSEIFYDSVEKVVEIEKADFLILLKNIQNPKDSTTYKSYYAAIVFNSN